MDYRASLGFTTSTSTSFTQHPRRSILEGFKAFSCDLSTGQIPGPFISGYAYHGLDVLHQKEQVKRIGRAGFKLPIEIPLLGRFVLGVNQQCTNPSNIRRLRCAQQRIFEQCFAKPCALVLKVHGKPSQNHHRHGVLWNAFGHTRCRTGRLNATHGQTVETNDRTRMATHVGLRAVGLLIDERKALQKLVQCRLTTIKGLNGVQTVQFAHWLISPRTQPSSPGSDKSFFSLSLVLVLTG